MATAASRIYLTVFGVILVLLIIGFVTSLRQPHCDFDYGPGLTTAQSAGKSQEDIAQLLTEKWLNNEKGVFACATLKLTDYHIDKVTIDSSTPDGSFVYDLTYDVKPPFVPFFDSDWVAGNGTPDHGWIKDKFEFVTVAKNSSGYHIVSVGTGP